MDPKFILRIYRGTPGHQYFEEFEVPVIENANIISALMYIRKYPYNREGKKVTPIVWEDGCLEEVCGSCSMLVNGFPRQACTALISHYITEKERVITLAPFTKFPLVRDLMIDRSVMFDNLKEIRGWIEAGKSWGEEFGPLISPETQEVLYALSTCMSCGCCSEACPQINEHSDFIGPAAISLTRYYNTNPTGKKEDAARLRTMMQEKGVSACGNAQNCVRVCPKEIPLTDSIAKIGRDTTLQAVRDLFDNT